ncbi:hypothetical protein GCM10009535_14530 [Streptomyces thermocarboxydovorans]|uniref:Uncharacterized protein n=1 Tax=Streptomyces thermocarboxydovorans TaxID=59298 RepID=A0ABP3SHA3_9ACTN
MAVLQPVEVFTRALTRAWDERPPVRLIDGGASGAEACGPDGCAVPQP